MWIMDESGFEWKDWMLNNVIVIVDCDVCLNVNLFLFEWNHFRWVYVCLVYRLCRCGRTNYDMCFKGQIYKEEEIVLSIYVYVEGKVKLN